MSRVMSYGENANGHTYTKKSHDVTKDQPRTVRPVPVDALCTNSYLLFVQIHAATNDNKALSTAKDRQRFPQRQEYESSLSFSFACFKLAPDMPFPYTHDSWLRGRRYLSHYALCRTTPVLKGRYTNLAVGPSQFLPSYLPCKSYTSTSKVGFHLITTTQIRSQNRRHADY